MNKQTTFIKRIAIFSDIHGNLEALESILNDIKENEYDEIIYLGDAISIGPQPKECLQLLKDNNVKFVLGNHELYYLRGTEIDNEIKDDQKEHLDWVKSQLNDSDREYLEKCPLYYECTIDYDKIPSNKILFAHFLIEDINAPYPFEDIRLKYDVNQWLKHNDEYMRIFIGHEHQIYKEDDIDGVDGNFEIATGELSNIWLVGSSGCTKDNKTTYTALEIGRSILTRRVSLTYDRETFLHKLVLIDYPDKDKIVNFAFGISMEELQNLSPKDKLDF